jgi:hypothetical protein
MISDRVQVSPNPVRDKDDPDGATVSMHNIHQDVITGHSRVTLGLRWSMVWNSL